MLLQWAHISLPETILRLLRMWSHFPVIPRATVLAFPISINRGVRIRVGRWAREVLAEKGEMKLRIHIMHVDIIIMGWDLVLALRGSLFSSLIYQKCICIDMVALFILYNREHPPRPPAYPKRDLSASSALQAGLLLFPRSKGLALRIDSYNTRRLSVEFTPAWVPWRGSCATSSS
jgi:hypothetical protein